MAFEDTEGILEFQKLNCPKTLSNYHFEGYFEREADSTKLLKMIRKQGQRMESWSKACTCKGGALEFVRRHHSVMQVVINYGKVLTKAEKRR